ncbi:MAG TPA: amidohydrolase family protein [Candidatus Binatia bacterium]|jgi:predicted TIM-barrel fold metal-dependent hydrolase
MSRQYKVISGDGHIDLNPDVWRDRVAAKWRDRAPKRVKTPNGSDAVVVDGGKPNTIGITRSVRVAHKDLAKQVPTFENSAGTGSPEQRLREQDQDGIEAEILFSQISFVMRQAKDDELYLELVRAYNEFLAEEYMAAAPDRLIPMGTIPITGVKDAIREMEHCAKLGLKGVKLDRFPSGRGYPTPQDDAFWSAALELKMPLTNHNTGTFRSGRGEPALIYEKEPGEDVHQREPLNYLFRFTNDAMMGAIQMAFAGVWDRFPTLEMYWAETMIGWFEYGLWQIDDHYQRYMPMIHENWGLKYMQRKPSEYLKDRNYWGFLHDPVGVQHRDCIGYDKLMWGTDFAHAASEWPNSVKIMEQDFAGVPEKERHAMLVGNSVRYFHLE